MVNSVASICVCFEPLPAVDLDNVIPLVSIWSSVLSERNADSSTIPYVSSLEMSSTDISPFQFLACLFEFCFTSF